VNGGQADRDGDGIGDSCNQAIDKDGDEWADALDNCPTLYNPPQQDTNHNGRGDLCEVDLYVASIEKTQGIQDLDGSVPMVSGKPIWLRVSVGTGVGVQVPAVTGRLMIVDRNGRSVPPGGLSKPWPEVITAKPVPDRGKKQDTLNFFVYPPAWYLEETDLYAQIDVMFDTASPGGSSREDMNPTNNRYGPFRLGPETSVRSLPINFVPVKTKTTAGSFCSYPDAGDFWQTADWVLKTYPLQYIDLWPNDAMKVDDTNHLLEKLYLRNTVSDDIVDDMKYYGLVCKQQVDLPGALGMAYTPGDEAWGTRGDSSDVLYGGSTMAQEIAHNFGRRHAPCGGPANVDPNYPAPNASIMEYGFDDSAVTATGMDVAVYSPANYRDFMSYCDPAWISPYTFKALFNKFR
jgi:hypothetical protein